MSDRQWRQIPSAPNYEASDDGFIRRSASGPNAKVGVTLKTRVSRGYHYLSTSHNGVVRQRQVHHLVAEAFIGQRPDGMVVRHNDGNANNNSAENLSYATQKENIADKHKHGTMLSGERHPNVRKSDAEMLVILRDALLIGQKPAARKHCVHQQSIQKILKGRSRAYLLEML